MIKKVVTALLLIFPVTLFAQINTARMDWVDSVFNTLSMNEKIGQLFIVELNPSDQEAKDRTEDQLKSHQIGGVFFTGSSATHQAAITKKLQNEADVPLLVAMDVLPQLGKLDSTIQFPDPFVLGAIQNDSLLMNLGYEQARQLKLLGVNLSFMPIGDLMVHDETEEINYLSFGDRSLNVGKKSVTLIKALQQKQILTCARYFPVRGLTVTDVQKGIPTVQVSLDSMESKPYQMLFDNKLDALVTTATSFPLFYSNVHLTKKNTYNSASLSALFTGQWLQKKMNYEGLVITNVKTIQQQTQKYRDGDAEALAFQAGNDLILFSEAPAAAIRKIKKLVRKNDIYKQQLYASVKKILSAKYDAGLNKKTNINSDNILLKLNSPSAQILNEQLQEAAITYVRTENNSLPLASLENKNFAYLALENTEPTLSFYHSLNKYTSLNYIPYNTQTDALELLNALADKDVILIAVFPTTPTELLHQLREFIKPLKTSHHIITSDFGNTTLWKEAEHFGTVVTSYTNSPHARVSMAEVIFGALPAQGKIPVAFSSQIPSGSGVTTEAIGRLRYSYPERAGMDSHTLARIDAIANEAITNKSTPGCQILVARKGKVIYEKSFGTYSYEDKTPVTDETIYDLASLTKVSATLQAVMFMQERGLIDIYKKVSVYLPELKNTNKKDITIVDMLTHQAGLVPFIPLWNQTVKDSLFLPNYYNRHQHPEYPLHVAPNLYAAPTLRDSVWMWIIKSKMLDKIPRTNYPYRYSDLGFMILQHLAERILNQPIDEFLQQNYYEPLGATTTCFMPLNRFDEKRIAPTELDNIYRRALIKGTVHDERAAMLGGVSGHAGLFSSANDLAKLAQMLLQEGYYGGTRYYQPETVKAFATKQFNGSRRGLGWDKPVQSDLAGSPTAIQASPSTYGHTGFTGTCMWIDPEFDLVYIFLSNRVYPNRNTKLITTNIRSRIQEVIYQSIFSYSASN